MNSQKRKQKICLKEFIPEKALCNKDANKSYDLNIIEDEHYFTLSYDTVLHNHTGIVGKKRYTLLLPKHMRRNKETFEVLGLLQAEMGKQHDGKVVFSNHEYRLINKVLDWFEQEFDFPKEKWYWYIKLNINEPQDQKYKEEVEQKVVTYWINKSNLPFGQAHPKRVSYIKNTNNKNLGFYDYGTLIIEKRSNLFSQIIKRLVKKISQTIIEYDDQEIRDFMRGILAGESCVEIHAQSKKYRVHLSVTNPDEKIIYYNCLKKLGIDSIIYPGDKLVISKKQNNLELLKQKLMTLSPEKYDKFLRMMSLYGEFDGLTEWRSNLQKPWNKIPQDKIDKIVELDKQHSDWPAWRIAELVGVSDIKVQRIRRAKPF